MKRGNPPKRRTPLKQGGPIQRKTRMPRGKGFTASANPAKPKSSHPKTAPKVVVDLVKTRSGGLCEIGLLCFGTSPATERAHRMGKGIGGPGSKGRKASDSPSDLLDACREDHDLLDRAAVAESYVHGYKIRHGVARPSEVPVLHVVHGWVLLDDQGGHRPAPAAVVRPGPLIPVIACTAWELINQDGAFIEAMQRFGHHDCPGRSAPRPGPFVCGCGPATVFYLEEVAS